MIVAERRYKLRAGSSTENESRRVLIISQDDGEDSRVPGAFGLAAPWFETFF
jgi:hypothetical protein